MIIAPSILAADFAHMAKELCEIEKAGADWVHLDVMDGHFVPNLTFGAPVIKKYRTYTSLPFDVHLMISNPDDYIEDFIDAGADIITVHIETLKNPKQTLGKIRSLGAKAGLSLNPDTNIEKIKPYINLCDVILIMTVNPGFGGQSFMYEQLEKIKILRKWLDTEKLSTIIEVDGGINHKTIQLAEQAGATAFVAGSAIFNGNYANNIKSLRNKDFIK